jgi:two-component system, NtrC family, response regulator HydG
MVETATKGRILIVDDQEGIRESMAGILEMEGYEIHSLEDGYKAIERVKEMSFDIAFLDVRMPGINGVETFREIKKLRPEMVVFMMTAYAEEELVRQALNEGAYACIHKPFDMDRIIEIVQNARRKLVVLVVDNDEVMNPIIARTLHSSGFDVKTATSGAEAIEAIQSSRYNLILLNTEIPDVKGVELYHTIKDIRPEAGIVIMSSGSQDDAVVNAVKNSSIAFLRKPFSPDKVVEIVKKLQDE